MHRQDAHPFPDGGHRRLGNREHAVLFRRPGDRGVRPSGQVPAPEYRIRRGGQRLAARVHGHAVPVTLTTVASMVAAICSEVQDQQASVRKSL